MKNDRKRGVTLHLQSPGPPRPGSGARSWFQSYTWPYAWRFHADPQAIDSFRAAQHSDKACAMCFWGEAFALGAPRCSPPPLAHCAAADAGSVESTHCQTGIGRQRLILYC